MGTRVIPPEVLSCAKQGEREPYLRGLPEKGSKKDWWPFPRRPEAKEKGRGQSRTPSMSSGSIDDEAPRHIW